MRGAIVTGAGTGIGAACARRLAEDGFGVVLSGRREESLRTVAAALGAAAVVVAGDVGDPAHADDLAATARETFGGIDAVVLNAGIGESHPVGDETLEGWDAVMRTNLTGAFLVARAALPGLVERSGALVAVASVNAWRAGPGWASYCTSKAGLVMLVQSIARDYGPKGVRANAVLPGWVRTPMGDEDMDALAAGTGSIATLPMTSRTGTSRPGVPPRPERSRMSLRSCSRMPPVTSAAPRSRSTAAPRSSTSPPPPGTRRDGARQAPRADAAGGGALRRLASPLGRARGARPRAPARRRADALDGGSGRAASRSSSRRRRAAASSTWTATSTSTSASATPAR